MAASRQKKLDERFGMEVNSKGHRFKLNRDREGYHFSNRGDAVLEDQDPPVRFTFLQPSALRTTGDLVTFDKVSFGYTRSKKLLEDVSFSLPQDGRMAFIGRNGEGKSTLANLVLQTLKPSSGSVLHHPLLNIGHYSQHSVEEVSAKVKGTKTTALEYFIAHFAEKGVKVEEPEARARLGSLGLSGKMAASTPVDGLSGGQKVRLFPDAASRYASPAADFSSTLVNDPGSTCVQSHRVSASPAVAARRGDDPPRPGDDRRVGGRLARVRRGSHSDHSRPVRSPIYRPLTHSTVQT